MVSATGRSTRPPTIPTFTILAGSVCNCFAPPGQWPPWCCETKQAWAAFIGLRCGAKELCSAKRTVLAIHEGARTVARRDDSTPPIGKELPMELTATMTAIMAIISFGFLAAVILGMI
jgi:hypothetical protein